MSYMDDDYNGQFNLRRRMTSGSIWSSGTSNTDTRHAAELADLRARFLAAIDELRGMADVMRQHQMLPNTAAAIAERVAELTGNNFQPDDLRERIEAEAYRWRQQAAILLDRGNPMALGLEQAAQRLLSLLAEKEAR